HTISKRDWSSDVCSSDLLHQVYGLHVIPDQRTDRFAEILKLRRAGHAEFPPEQLPGHMRSGRPVAGSSQAPVFHPATAYLSRIEIGRASCRERVANVAVS